MVVHQSPSACPAAAVRLPGLVDALLGHLALGLLLQRGLSAFTGP